MHEQGRVSELVGDPMGGVAAASRRLGMWRPEDRSLARVTTARFAVSAAVLPALTEALAVGERVRLAMLRCSDGHPVFLGRDTAGNVVRGERHEHAWFLPADDDADGAIDHVVMYARAGFDAAAITALARLRRVWGHGGSELKLRLVDMGPPDEVCGKYAAEGRLRVPQLGTAQVWESLTPFVPPRHVKVRRGELRDAPHDQVARLLALHGFPPARVEPLAAAAVTSPRPPSPIDWDAFRRLRTTGGGCRGVNAAFGFRLQFERPVTGPIALGYGAHQGLGQFIAVR